jgi:hypothetical protein
MTETHSNIFNIEKEKWNTKGIVKVLKSRGVIFSYWAKKTFKSPTSIVADPTDGHIGFFTAKNLGLGTLSVSEICGDTGREILGRLNCDFVENDDALHVLRLHLKQQLPMVAWYVQKPMLVSTYQYICSTSREGDTVNLNVVEVSSQAKIDPECILGVRINPCFDGFRF